MASGCRASRSSRGGQSGPIRCRGAAVQVAAALVSMRPPSSRRAPGTLEREQGLIPDGGVQKGQERVFSTSRLSAPTSIDA